MNIKNIYLYLHRNSKIKKMKEKNLIKSGLEFVTFEIAEKLKEKGLNIDSLFAFNDMQIINPEVIKKYGELTDDGYYELTKDGGGELEWDDVYIYQQQLLQRREIIIRRNFVLAPTISQVLKWLREEKDLIITTLYNSNGWSYWIQRSEDALILSKKDNFSFFDNAIIEAINYTLDNLI